MAKRKRNYAKEGRWEASTVQKKRRAARNAARRKAIKKYGKAALKGKELDHVGYHRTGDLRKVKTRIVSRHANRIRQPKRGKRKGKG
jgi:hypothetical protein